jgi:predicted dehydrogenase
MQGVHQGILDDLSGRIAVTATADINLDRAMKAVKFLGANVAFADCRKIFEYVDACLVVTPHDLHHDMGIAELQAHKHLFMKKPIALGEAECLDLITTADHVGKTLMVVYPMRYHQIVVKVKELIARRYLGDTFHVGIFTEQLTEPLVGSWIRSAQHLGGEAIFQLRMSLRRFTSLVPR